MVSKELRRILLRAIRDNSFFRIPTRWKDVEEEARSYGIYMQEERIRGERPHRWLEVGLWAQQAFDGSNGKPDTEWLREYFQAVIAGEVTPFDSHYSEEDTDAPS